MTQKTFYINLNKQNFLDKSAINKILAFKSFVRYTVKNKEEVKIIDNNSKFSTIYLKKDTNMGTLLNNQQHILKHKLDNKLKLQVTLGETNYTKFTTSQYKSAFENTLKTRTLRKKEPVIILESIKGGFYVYYSGIRGFLPQSQY